MASRFWVGGTGNWDAATTTHWSASSGGGGGASVPTSSDDVTFDSSSNATAYTVTVTATANCANLTMAAPASGKITFAGSSTLNVAGNINLSGGTAGITFSFSGSLIFTATAGTKTISTSSVVLVCFVQFNGSGGTFQLLDDLTQNLAGNNLDLHAGIFDANNKNVSSTSFNVSGATVNMGSGIWTGTGGLSAWQFTSGTINANTSTIKITSSNNAKITFAGGGKTYNNVWFARGSNTNTNAVTGSNTFNDFKDDGSVAHTLSFAAGTTQTFTTFTVSGTAGNLIAIDSSTTATHALVKSGGGTISCDYVTVQHSVATPSSTWYAGVNSTNNQATATSGSGWNFATAYSLAVTVGIFTLTGNSVNFPIAHRLQTSVGAFTLTGNSVNFPIAHRLQTSVGAFTLTGNDASFVKSLHLSVSVGAFTLTGNPVNLTWVTPPIRSYSAMRGRGISSMDDTNRAQIMRGKPISSMDDTNRTQGMKGTNTHIFPLDDKAVL